jgi:hypothetical protein
MVHKPSFPETFSIRKREKLSTRDAHAGAGEEKKRGGKLGFPCRAWVAGFRNKSIG